MFNETSEGQTHYQNDGCGEPAHNQPQETKEEMGGLAEEKPCIHTYETGKHEYNCLVWNHRKDYKFWIPTCQSCDWVDTDRIIESDYVKNLLHQNEQRVAKDIRNICENQIVITKNLLETDPKDKYYKGFQSGFRFVKQEIDRIFHLD